MMILARVCKFRWVAPFVVINILFNERGTMKYLMHFTSFSDSLQNVAVRFSILTTVKIFVLQAITFFPLVKNITPIPIVVASF
jgi:hypothetical protein